MESCRNVLKSAWPSLMGQDKRFTTESSKPSHPLSYKKVWEWKAPKKLQSSISFSYSWEGTDHVWDWTREHVWKKVVPSQSLSSPLCFIYWSTNQETEQELFSPVKGGKKQKQGDIVSVILSYTQEEKLSALHRWRAALSVKDVFWGTLPISTA